MVLKSIAYIAAFLTSLSAGFLCFLSVDRNHRNIILFRLLSHSHEEISQWLKHISLHNLFNMNAHTELLKFPQHLYFLPVTSELVNAKIVNSFELCLSGDTCVVLVFNLPSEIVWSIAKRKKERGKIRSATCV